MGKAEGCGSYGCHYEKHVFNCDISWVVIALGGLYFVDSIWGLPVRQIRFHRTAATGITKKTSRLPPPSCQLTCQSLYGSIWNQITKKIHSVFFLLGEQICLQFYESNYCWVLTLFYSQTLLMLRLIWCDSRWWICPLIDANADVA